MTVVPVGVVDEVDGLGAVPGLGLFLVCVHSRILGTGTARSGARVRTGDDLFAIALERGGGVLEEHERRQDDPVHSESCERRDFVERVGSDGAVATGRELDRVGIAPGVARRGPNDVEKGAELLVRSLRREEPVAQPSGPARGHVGVSTDVNRNRAPHGPRFGDAAVERREAALVRRGAVPPECTHRADGVIGSRSPLAERHADRVELLLQPARADAEQHPAPTETVERGELLGEHDRISLRQDQHAGGQVDPRRSRGEERQPHERVRDG